MIGLKNIFIALVAFSSAINALVVLVNPSTIVRGGSTILTVSNGAGETATTANVVFTGTGGATYAVDVVVGTAQAVTLPYSIYGSVTLVATATAGTAAVGTATMTVTTPYNPYYYPCYNPCYNPCYRPSNRCYRPSNGCNIPRPRENRCRIRMIEEPVEQQEQQEQDSEILFAGFSIFPEEAMNELEAEQLFFEQIDA